MNWITILCVAIFLSCQCSVGHGQGEETPVSPEEFERYYKKLVTPVIAKTMRCEEIELTYYQGTIQVRIRFRPSMHVFCFLHL